MYQKIRKEYPYLCEVNNLNQNTNICEETIYAEELIHPWRLDFMAKLLFLDGICDAKMQAAGEEIYKKHLIAFSNGTLAEKGQKDKKGFGKYYDTFYSLWNYCSEEKEQIVEKWPSVPVDRDYLPMDGAHRIACAIKNKKQIKIYHIDFVAPEYCRYDFKYWRAQFLDEHYIVEMVKKYCAVRPVRLLEIEDGSQRLCEAIYGSCVPVYMNLIGSKTIVVLDEKVSDLQRLEVLLSEQDNIVTREHAAVEYLSLHQGEMEKESLSQKWRKKAGRCYRFLRSQLWSAKDRLKNCFR